MKKHEILEAINKLFEENILGKIYKNPKKPFYNMRKQDLDYLYKHIDLDAKDVNLYCETCGHINGYHLEGCAEFIPHNGECNKGNCPACPVTHTRGSHSDDFSDTEPCYCNKKEMDCGIM